MKCLFRVEKLKKKKEKRKKKKKHVVVGGGGVFENEILRIDFKCGREFDQNRWQVFTIGSGGHGNSAESSPLAVCTSSLPIA